MIVYVAKKMSVGEAYVCIYTKSIGADTSNASIVEAIINM